MPVVSAGPRVPRVEAKCSGLGDSSSRLNATGFSSPVVLGKVVNLLKPQFSYL